MIAPKLDTKGQRRDARRGVRAWLGVSRDGPPSLTAVLAAVRKLDQLLDLTTNGRLRVQVRGRDQEPVAQADLRALADEWSET